MPVSLAESVARISTQYHKVAHVESVTYSIYSLNKQYSSEQILLELELQIRHEHPRILLAYSNKSLYYFSFGHWIGSIDADAEHENGVQNEANLKLEALYPQLVLKLENTMPVEKLAHPMTNNKTKNESPENGDSDSDENLAYACLSFLKAVKKTLVYNLSASGKMYMFGNYVIGRVSNTSSQYVITLLDPVLLANGDLLVSITQKSTLPLFHSGVLNLDHTVSEFASCFVIYVVPSGLRCHLYDSSDLASSFTTTPPKSSETLLNLLKSSTGVDLTEKESILWVKLIPNLQHLNNQTSDISRFVHDVDNKKYILWPWELCILQFGSVEADKTGHQEAWVDPLSLVNDYMAFSLSQRENMKNESIDINANDLVPASHQNLNNAESGLGFGSAMFPPIPSSVASDLPDPLGGADISRDLVSAEKSVSLDLSKIDQNVHSPESGPSLDRFFEGKSINEEAIADEILEDDDNDTDLFGESSDSESKNADELVDSKPDIEPSPGPKNIGSEIEKDVNEKENASPSSNQPKDVSAVEVTDNSEPLTYMGIPKSEMISAEIRSFTPGSYDDPGAPPPIVPTPALPQQHTFNANNGFSSSSQVPQVPNKLYKNLVPPQRDRRQSEPASGWAFSPLVFNPKIKYSIDAKYGKGGKFYVDTEDSSGPDSEPRKVRHRETSAQVYEQVLSQESVKSEGPKEASVVSSSERSFLAKNGENVRPSSIELIPGDDKNGDLEEDHMLSSDGDNDAEDDNGEDEIEEMEDVESDEDEEMEEGESGEKVLGSRHRAGEIHENTSFEPKNLEISGLALPTSLPDTSSAQFSPLTSRQKDPKQAKDHSPFGLGFDSSVYSMSPLPAELRSVSALETIPQVLDSVSATAESQPETDTSPKQRISAEPETNTPTSNTSSSSGISESSNCLPLILRSINVQTIPHLFLLRKIPGAWGEVSINRDFDMEVDDEDNDLSYKDTGLYVRTKNMDELLNWLVPTLVFNSGCTDLESQTQLKLPDFFTESVSLDVTDSLSSEMTTDAFRFIFPSSHTVTLDELLSEVSVKSAQTAGTADFKDEGLFEDLTTKIFSDNGQLDSGADKHQNVFWDVFQNSGSTHKPYKQSISTMADAVFSFDEVKMKARKNSKDLINFNSLGGRFWKYLNLKPFNGPKSFQILMVTESASPHENTVSNTSDFLDQLLYNYANIHFGNVKKLNIQKFENRPDLDGVSNGILTIEKGLGDRSRASWYKRSNRKLKDLAELIKLDIINRTNKFEFDRPLLLLFIDFDESASSVLQISKLCRNFKVSLKNHQLSLVHVFAHVVPSSSIYKTAPQSISPKYLSDVKLSKISKLLYNKCPNTALSAGQPVTHDEDEPKKLYSQLVKPAPSSLSFKLFNRPNKESLYSEGNDDMFLHVAYERSVDKNWICAAWSDPLGTVTQLKAWYCPPAAKDGFNEDVHDLASIIFKIWEVSNKLFLKLSDDLSQRTSGLGKKRYLVLTRVSSIIPDDELLYWKRLTAKYKDISLIVLTTNRAPKYLFDSYPQDSAVMPEDVQAARKGTDTTKRGIKIDNSEFDHSLEAFPISYNSASPTNSMPMSTSPLNGALSLHSPQQFANVPSGMFFSYDNRSNDHLHDENCTLKDTSAEFVGIIPKATLPSCNSPTRFSMRTGYMIKRAMPSGETFDSRFVVFEVSLLSCSNHWNLDIVMKIILKQFRKLGALNALLGICDESAVLEEMAGARKSELQALVPWHINAVVKALDYLVHVHVGE